MDLVKCRFCYGLVAPTAKVCMHCRSAQPAAGRRARALPLAIAIAALIAVIYFLLPSAVSPSRQVPDTTDMMTELKDGARQLFRGVPKAFAVRSEPGDRKRCETLPTIAERIACDEEVERGPDPCGKLAGPVAELECRERSAPPVVVIAEETPVPTPTSRAQPTPQTKPVAARPRVSPPQPIPPPARALQDPAAVFRQVALTGVEVRVNNHEQIPIVRAFGMIENRSERDIYEFTLNCVHLDGSGAHLTNVEVAMKRRVRAGETLAFEDVDMGDADVRFQRLSCRISGVGVE